MVCLLAGAAAGAWLGLAWLGFLPLAFWACRRAHFAGLKLSLYQQLDVNLEGQYLV